MRNKYEDAINKFLGYVDQMQTYKTFELQNLVWRWNEKYQKYVPILDAEEAENAAKSIKYKL